MAIPTLPSTGGRVFLLTRTIRAHYLTDSSMCKKIAMRFAVFILVAAGLVWYQRREELRNPEWNYLED